jgi:hypothetical protein
LFREYAMADRENSGAAFRLKLGDRSRRQLELIIGVAEELGERAHQ